MRSVPARRPPGLRFPVAADAENTCANDNFNRQSAFLNELVAKEPGLHWIVMAGMWRTFDSSGQEIDYWSGKPVASFEPVTPTALDAYVGAIERQLTMLGDIQVTLVLDGPRRGLAVERQWQRQAAFPATPAHCSCRVSPERSRIRSDVGLVRPCVVPVEPATRCQSPEPQRQRRSGGGDGGADRAGSRVH